MGGAGIPEGGDGVYQRAGRRYTGGAGGGCRYTTGGDGWVYPRVRGLEKPVTTKCITYMSKLDIFSDPNFRASHLGLSHCIALTTYR